jgi:hypothetical protein
MKKSLLVLLVLGLLLCTNVEAARPGSLSIHVYKCDFGCEPVRNALVSVNCVPYYWGAGLTDSNGYLYISNVKAGWRSVDARKQIGMTSYHDEQKVYVQPGVATSVNLYLTGWRP